MTNYREKAEETSLTFLVLETATSEVDDLDRTLCRVFQENVLYRSSSQHKHTKRDSRSTHLGFEITVNDTMMTKER